MNNAKENLNVSKKSRSTVKTIKLSVPEALEALKQDSVAYWEVYNNKSELQNYNQEGSFFYRKTAKDAQDMIVKRALELGLDPKLKREFKLGSDFMKSRNPEQWDEGREFWFDRVNGVKFSSGNLYRLTINKEGDVALKLVLSAPLQLSKIVKTDDGWQIGYTFNGDKFENDIKSLVSHISTVMRSTRDANNLLAEFLFRYLDDAVNNGNYVVVHSPIYVENGLIKIGYDIRKIDLAKNLRLLRNFYPLATHPRAFLSALAYNLIAPLAYEIRMRSPPGYLFPIRISFGRTGGAKTSMDSIFVRTGYDQSKEDSMLTNEQVATAFTFAKNMGSSSLPILINDVSPDWLDKVSTVLKNSSENPIANERGNPDQSSTRRRMKRALNVTSNEILIPSDDAAKHRRYIMEEYTADHEKRQNPEAFSNFMHELDKGFMFPIFEAIFGDKKMDEIIEELVKCRDSVAFVNHLLVKINELNAKFTVDPYLTYTQDESTVNDSFSELAEYFMDQWKRLHSTDDYGRPVAPYPEISTSELDIDDLGDGIYNLWFTGASYKIANARLKLPHKTASSLFANYVRNRNVEIFAKGKNHRFNGISASAFALLYRVGERL